MDALLAILTRRSVREFQDKEIPPNVLAEIIKCGVKAPSSSNEQPWEFVVVKDQKKKEKIGYFGARSLFERKKRKLKDAKKRFDIIAKAPVYIVVACDTKKSPIFWKHDGSAATQNILIAAHSLGLGAVWLGAPVALKKHSSEIKKLLDIPRQYEIASIVAMGFPSKMPKPRPEGNMKDMVHFEKW